MGNWLQEKPVSLQSGSKCFENYKQSVDLGTEILELTESLPTYLAI